MHVLPFFVIISLVGVFLADAESIWVPRVDVLEGGVLNRADAVVVRVAARAAINRWERCQ